MKGPAPSALLTRPWIVRKTTCDGIGNVVKGFLSALSVNPRSYVQVVPGYRLGRYDLALAPEHVWDPVRPLGLEGEDHETLYTCRLLILQSEEWEQPLLANEYNHPPFTTGNPRLEHFYSGRSAIDWHYDSSRLAGDVASRIDRAVASVRFLPTVHELVRNALASVVSSPDGRGGGPLIGVSVRTWKAPHEQGVHRAYDPAVYRAALEPLLPGSAGVLLSVDCEEETEAFVEWLRPRTPRLRVLEWGKDVDATREAFAKMLSLARCDVVVGARLSTFLELVFWFSGRKAKIVPVH